MSLAQGDILSLSKPRKQWSLVSLRVRTDSKTHLTQREKLLNLTPK